jgi:hypothetical protein
MDFLSKLSMESLTDEELLESSLSGLTPEDLLDIAYAEGIKERPGLLEDIQEKFATAHRMGQELAREHGSELEKEAILGAIAGAGRALAGASKATGGLGAVKSIGKDLAVGAATNTIANSVGKARQGFQGVAPAVSGGFKYAGVLPSLGQKLVGAAVRHPGAAMAAGGAALGAMAAPVDPQTGQKQYLRGAAMGAGLGYAGSKIPMLRRSSGPGSVMGMTAAGGDVGSALRKAVVGKQQLLGGGAANYARNAVKATAPAAGGAAKAMASAETGAALKDLHTPAPTHDPRQYGIPNQSQARAIPSNSAAPDTGKVSIPESMRGQQPQMPGGGFSGALEQQGKSPAGSPSYQGRWNAALGAENPAPATMASPAATPNSNMPTTMTPAAEARKQLIGQRMGKIPTRQEQTSYTRNKNGYLLVDDNAPPVGMMSAPVGVPHRPVGAIAATGVLKMASVRNALMKLAAMQTLNYNPAAKSFTRQHLTATPAIPEAGMPGIQAGHIEPVKSTPGVMSSMAQKPMTTSPGQMAAPAGGMISSAKRMPPPIPIAAGHNTMSAAGSALKKLPSLKGFSSLARR